CDVCGRTILKGERTEPFLAPGGKRQRVCELCFSRAEHHGWIRESAAGDVPSRVPRAEPRRPWLGRLRRRRDGEPPSEPRAEHQRTVAGVARTLGAPWITALPDLDQQSAVTVVVAWELSWYRFRVDLGDEADPVVMLEKGHEIEEIDEPLRDWNATMDARGQ